MPRALGWLALAVSLGAASCEGSCEPERDPSEAESVASATASSSPPASATTSTATAEAPPGPLELATCPKPAPLPVTEAARAALRTAKSLPREERARAVGLYEDACHGGILDACLVAARLLAKPGHVLGGDVVRAVRLVNFACDHGDALACEDLGSRYLSAGGVPKDERRAAYKFSCACELGSAEACFSIATIFREERVPDLRRGQALDALACNGGVAGACERLAEDHDKGVIEGASAARARELDARTLALREQQCAEGELPFECAELSRTLRRRGGKADAARAVALSKRACEELSHGIACYDAAKDVEEGRAHADAETLRLYFTVACRAPEASEAERAEACDKSRAPDAGP